MSDDKLKSLVYGCIGALIFEAIILIALIVVVWRLRRDRCECHNYCRNKFDAESFKIDEPNLGSTDSQFRRSCSTTVINCDNILNRPNLRPLELSDQFKGENEIQYQKMNFTLDAHQYETIPEDLTDVTGRIVDSYDTHHSHQYTAAVNSIREKLNENIPPTYNSYQYDSTNKTVNHSSKDINERKLLKYYGSNVIPNAILEDLTEEFNKLINHGKHKHQTNTDDKQVQCNLHDTINCSFIPEKDNVPDSNSDDTYEQFINLPRLRRNTLEEKPGDNLKTFGSTDHLRYLNECPTKITKRELSYMETKRYVPKENCPENLRSLCYNKEHVPEHLLTLPNRRRCLTEPNEKNPLL